MFTATKTAEQRMLEFVDVNHVAKFLAYYMRADRRND